MPDQRLTIPCPHCGRVACDLDVAAGTVISTKKESLSFVQKEKQQSTSDDAQPRLPMKADRPAKSTTPIWIRAMAIAHLAIDRYADSSSQIEHIKSEMALQGLPYGSRDPDGQPLYARAHDAALTQRRRRAGASR